MRLVSVMSGIAVLAVMGPYRAGNFLPRRALSQDLPERFPAIPRSPW
jgi:hypothetical protein